MTVSDSDIPEPDRAEGAPHPRHTLRLIGQTAAERLLQHAVQSGRLHHAWLITGPPGIGKATLAWRAARFLLADADGGDGLFGTDRAEVTTLDTDPDTPRNRRISAMSEPSLFLLRRGWDAKAKRLRSVIAVDEVRRLRGFFALSRPDGGRRVVIVDAAEDMNLSAANALLKLLEEPPDRTTLLLVSHQPARLLPTIRSRCQELRLQPLSHADLSRAMQGAGVDPGDAAPALADLTGGSVGRSISLMQNDGLAIYAELVDLIAGLPALDRPRAIALAEAAARRGAEEKRALVFELLDLVLTRLARTGALGSPPPVEASPGEGEILTRLSPDAARARAWAELAQSASARVAHGLAVNLDPATLILDTVFKIQKTAAG